MKPDRFLIGYVDNNSGYQTNVKPWLLPDNAFQTLENAYVFRGRVRKRLGSIWTGTDQLSSRLRYQLTNTDSSGNGSGTVPGAIFAPGQQFSINSDIFTVNTTGTPATLLSTNSSASMTYNTSTGAYTITNADASAEVFFYPATPVMGLYQYYVPATKDYQNIAFDLQFSYFYDKTLNSWVALTTGTATWTGDDTQFFWATNYNGTSTNTNYLWVTNYNDNDGIRYFDGTTWTTPTLTIDSSGDTVLTALMIIEFKNRLILLNTIEDISSTPTLYFNRVRYSEQYNATGANSWRQDLPGYGGALDAPVNEAIVTAQFIKDRLIVYFTNSTFELAYTGNQVNPFQWQLLNTELGAESTFSEIPFDKDVLGVDEIGIHACNGSNVSRIDETIPQVTFGFSNDNNERERIVGIRDYYTELAYWSYPNSIRNNQFYFPNRMLVFNYINNSWATFEDSITFMGYFPFQLENSGATWGNTYNTWQELTIMWNSAADTLTTPTVKSVIAGNQQGFVFILRPELTCNASVLQVTDVSIGSNGYMTLTIINHNLEFNNFILLSTMNGLTFTDSNSNTLATVMAQINSDPFTSGTPNSVNVLLLDNEGQAVTITGTYTGGGTAARVSNINIVTKQYNFYTAQDRSCYVSKIDFLVDKTNQGQVTVDYYISSSQNALLSGSLKNGALPGNSILETSPYTLVPFEQFQDRLWHPLYFYSEGECVQYSMYMSPNQMFQYTIDNNGNIQYTALEDFQLHAMAIYAQPTSMRMQ
jgi:hypothetical protein